MWDIHTHIMCVWGRVYVCRKGGNICMRQLCIWTVCAGAMHGGHVHAGTLCACLVPTICPPPACPSVVCPWRGACVWTARPPLEAKTTSPSQASAKSREYGPWESLFACHLQNGGPCAQTLRLGSGQIPGHRAVRGSVLALETPPPQDPPQLIKLSMPGLLGANLTELPPYNSHA